MTHTEMDELYDLYALGTLEPEFALEIDRHVTERCEYCLEHIRNAEAFTAVLAGIAEPAVPSKNVRRRIFAAVTPEKPSRTWLFAVAALSAACVVLAAVSFWSQTQISQTRQEIASLSGERDQLREALQIMSRSETRSVQFGKAEDVPHGRVFLNRNGGLVFVGSQLPQLARDRTFELWLVPNNGAPRPAGLFRPNATGSSVNVSSLAVDAAETKAVAVSIEPLSGSSAPTTTPILVVPLAASSG